jgi:hypothetical protein
MLSGFRAPCVGCVSLSTVPMWEFQGLGFVKNDPWISRLDTHEAMIPEENAALLEKEKGIKKTPYWIAML